MEWGGKRWRNEKEERWTRRDSLSEDENEKQECKREAGREVS